MPHFSAPRLLTFLWLLAVSAHGFPLGDFETGRDSWRVKSGPESQNTSATAERAKEAAHGQKFGLKIKGDFSKGGRVIELNKTLNPSLDLHKLTFWVQAENLLSVTVRLTNAAGQSRRESCLIPMGAGWKQITAESKANDPWSGPFVAISLILEKAALESVSKPLCALSIDDLEAEGNYLTPLPAAGPLQMQLATARPRLFYWGKGDAPATVWLDCFASAAEAKTPTIRVLDYKGALVQTIAPEKAALKAGETAHLKYELKLGRFGFFTLAVDAGRQTAEVPLVWLAAVAPEGGASFLGVQTHFAHGPTGRHQVLGGAEGTLDLVAKMGAGWYRDDNQWPSVEGEAGVLKVFNDPENPFFQPAVAAEKHLRPLVVLGGASKFYDGGVPPTSPGGLAAFKRYVETAVRAWKPYVSDWEIWNEPNIIPGWNNQKPDPVTYAAILKAAYPAIKAVDPKATVAAMTTSGIDLKFIETVLKNGAAQSLDVVSVHPYLNVAPEGHDPEIKVPTDMDLPDAGGTFLGDLKNLRAVLDRNGAERCRIWITEMGYSTKKERHLTELRVAQEETRQILLSQSVPGVDRISKYNFQDRSDDPNGNFAHLMGLLHFNGAPKVSYVAYNTIARLLAQRHFVESHDNRPEVRLLEFGNKQGQIFAAWAVTGKSSVMVETKAPFVVLTDLMGNETKKTVTGGTFTVEVTEEPVFVAPGR